MDAVTGRIAAVGNGTAPVGASGGKATDLMGAVVVPGMIDAHLHVVMGGLSLSALNLGSARSLHDLTRRLEAYRESRPVSESEWLGGLAGMRYGGEVVYLGVIFWTFLWTRPQLSSIALTGT